MDCRAYLVVVSNRFWETMYLDYSASLGPKKSDRLDPPTLSANSITSGGDKSRKALQIGSQGCANRNEFKMGHTTIRLTNIQSLTQCIPCPDAVELFGQLVLALERYYAI